MDRYQMLSVLGEGTYGIVYRCLDTETDAIVAIKRFYNLDASEYTRQAMQRELAALKLLRGCSYIVQMDRVVRVSDTHVCMVMEFVPHTLLDVLEKAKPHGLPLQPLRVFLYTLLRAVESCHQHGIIHRDIKPENILMRADGPVSLCDFGFARLSHTGATRNEYTISQEANNSGDRMSNHDAGSREDEFDAVGRADCANSSTSVMTSYVATRWYRSPEMLLKIPYYGGEVDVWAVGCVFAEAADGEPLLPGESEMEQLALITTRVGPLPPSCLDLLQQSRQMTMPPTTDQATANGVDTSAPGQCANPGDCAPPDEPGEAAGKYDTTYVHKGHHDMRTSSSRALVSETSVTRVSPYIQDRYGMCLGQDGVNLLSGLLHPDARQRLSADRALLHPFFADLHAAHTLQLDTKHSKDGKQTASRAITQTKDAKGGNGTVTRPVLVHFSPSTYDTTRDKHNCKRVQHSKKHSFDRSRTECARRICAQLPTVIHDSRRARREDCMRSARGHRGFATIFSASSSSYYTSPKAHTPRRQLVNHTRRTEAEPFATTSTTTGKEMWQTQSPAAVAATAAVAAMQARRDDDLARGRAKQSIEKSSLLRDVRCRSSSPRCTLPTATGALTSSVATRQRHLPSSSPRRAAPRDTVTLPNTATAPALKKLPAAVAIARRARAVRQTAGQQMHGLLESMTSFRGSSTSNVSARTTVCSIGTPARFASTPATNNSASVSSCIGPVSSGPSSSRATTLFRFISLTRSRAVGAPRQQKSEHSPTFSGKSNLLPHRIARVGADNSSCSGADSSSKTMTVHAMRPRNNTNVYAMGDTTASVTHSRSTALWRSGTTHATSRPTQPSPSWRLPSITNRHSSALHFSATIEPSTTASVYVAGDAVSAKSPDQTMDSAMTHSADVDSTNSLIRKAERTN